MKSESETVDDGEIVSDEPVYLMFHDARLFALKSIDGSVYIFILKPISDLLEITWIRDNIYH